MNFVRVISEPNAEDLEKEINKVISDNIKNVFVDIKYSSSPVGHRVVHTAVIIFERPS